MFNRHRFSRFAPEGVGSTGNTNDDTPLIGDDDNDRLNAQLERMVEDGNGIPDASTTTPQEGQQATTPPVDKPGEQQAGQTGQTQPTGEQSPQEGQQGVSAPEETFGGRLRSDNEGNLIDGNNNVVAKAGKERRLWEEATRLKHITIPELRNELVEAQRKVTEVTALNNTPQQLGITNAEADQGLRLIASYKSNPLATIQYILAEARAAGVDLSSVGMAPQVDTAAIGRMIDKRLQPMVQDRETQQQDARINQEAQQQYDTFLTKFPDVAIHEGAIANMLASDAKLSLDAAYYQLRLFVQQNNLDWSKPLEPQIRTRMDQPQQGGNQQQTQPNTPPMGGHSGNAQTTPVENTGVVADADAEYADIIRESMRDVGMRPN